MHDHTTTYRECGKTVCKISVADPGFPVGGERGPHRGGGVHSRGGYVSKTLYVKMKESGPLGGGACAGHLPM